MTAVEPTIAGVELSVVIPAYNEEAIISETIGAVSRYLTGQGLRHEILVVDDGSMDRTVERVLAASAQWPSVRLLRSGHRGKGGAVKLGMRESRGAYVLFMDADQSTRIDAEWEKFRLFLQEGYELVIGSRKMPGAQVTVHQPRLREVLGTGFTWLTNLLVGVRVSDITCGFKAFQGPAARTIVGLQRMDGWGFDAELLFIARRLGYRIKEVPVRWADDAATKVKLLRDTVDSLRELLTIRIGGWRGWYRPTGEAVEPPTAKPAWVARQAEFYATRPHTHLQYAPNSVYARNLVEHLLEVARLPGDSRVLEVGCGAGRFSIPLLQRLGGELTTFDLSEPLLEQLRRHLSGLDRTTSARCRVVSGDIHHLEESIGAGQFDAAIGFFFLHHLDDLQGALANMRMALRPGGRMFFIEPNRRNPLFLLQVLCCPDMTWRDERGMFTLGQRRIREAFAAAGLSAPRIETFGWFPPQILDRWPRTLRLEKRIEGMQACKPILPFRLISSRRLESEEALAAR